MSTVYPKTAFNKFSTSFFKWCQIWYRYHYDIMFHFLHDSSKAVQSRKMILLHNGSGIKKTLFNHLLDLYLNCVPRECDIILSLVISVEKKRLTTLINSLVFRYSSLMKNLKKYKHLCERINFKDWMHHAWLIGKNIFRQYIIPKAKIKRTSHNNKEMEKYLYILFHMSVFIWYETFHIVKSVVYFLLPMFFFSLNLARSKYPIQNYFLYVSVMFFN